MEHLKKEELLCVGEEIYEIGFVEDESGYFGVGINAPAIVKGKRQEKVGIIFTWDGIWNCLGGIGTRMKMIGFEIKHPIKFNKLFRKRLKEHPIGKAIVKTYEDELKWKRQNRKWKKTYGTKQNPK